MAIVLESTQTTTYAASSSVTITKPTSLAVGDLLLATLSTANTSNHTWTVPSGWTALHNTYYSGGPAGTLGILYKVADSSDVAASNFTFTCGSAAVTGGMLSRITGYGTVTDSQATTHTDPTSPVTYASNITPTLSNALCLFVCWGGLGTTGTTVTFSNHSIATSNPTWASAGTITKTDTLEYACNLSYATRPESTAWGDASFAFTASAGADFVSFLVSIAPQVNGSHSITSETHYIVNQPFIRTGAMTLDGDDPSVSSAENTVWTTTPKA